MSIIAIVLEAIAALGGPAADMFKSLFTAAQTFHAGDTTPDQLAKEAVELAKEAQTLVSDVDTQISIVRQGLAETHHDIPATVATHVAAAAVEHVSK
ncbi:MAG: hypothetical protein KGJ45_11525 [Elusimicrobia bacterium]|nr:hypothetical protein [Elusimicrobiota bacterium]